MRPDLALAGRSPHTLAAWYAWIRCETSMDWSIASAHAGSEDCTGMCCPPSSLGGFVAVASKEWLQRRFQCCCLRCASSSSSPTPGCLPGGACPYTPSCLLERIATEPHLARKLEGVSKGGSQRQCDSQNCRNRIANDGPPSQATDCRPAVLLFLQFRSSHRSKFISCGLSCLTAEMST